MARPSLTVVVPVYNSANILPELVQRLKPVLESEANEFELILVNDGSPDRSWEVVSELANSHSWIRGLNLMRNYGQHNALLCGIRSARGEIVITMDDDLQHPPEEIPELLRELEDGFDVVYGTPVKEQQSFWRNFASRVMKLTFYATMGVQIARSVSAFRAFRTSLRDAFANYRSPYVSIDVLLTWGTSAFSAVKVHHQPRKIGSSNYTIRTLLRLALNMLSGFSTLPLQFASMVGFIFTVFGIGVLTYVLVRYFLEGGSVAGFPFLASVIAIFSGSQLFALGIIGEYLARVHERIMDRPVYMVRSETPERVISD